MKCNLDVKSIFCLATLFFSTMGTSASEMNNSGAFGMRYNDILRLCAYGEKKLILLYTAKHIKRF